jgi:8-oxo-dGTP pyrophosphatase MutT (NUDIX family)
VIDLDELAARLGPPRPRPRTYRAAVAIVLRPGPRGPECLLMRRTARAGDRWSGDVSFPGGFRHGDEDPVTTARRETFEEVGLSLGEPLGALADAPGRPWTWLTPFTITPVVFRADAPPSLVLSEDEVVSARWIALLDLYDEANRDRFWWGFTPGRARTRPRIPLRMPRVHIGDYDIWGLTLEILFGLPGGPNS